MNAAIKYLTHFWTLLWQSKVLSGCWCLLLFHPPHTLQPQWSWSLVTWVNISKVAYKLVLLTKCEEKTVPTTQLTQGYQSCCQPSVQLSTLRTSYPSPLASNLCAAIFLWNYVQCISEVQFALAIQTFSEELGRQTGITLSESKRMDGSTWMGAKFFLPDCHVILFTW